MDFQNNCVNWKVFAKWLLDTILDRKLFGLIASVLKEASSTSMMDFVISLSTTLRNRSEVHSEKAAQIKPEFVYSSEDDYFVIHWDSKVVAEFMGIHSDRIVIIVTGTNKDTKVKILLTIAQAIVPIK